eukprot:CAMPEP_0184368654 /NCGR_PEP_ID=MMETSP1089-20130417/161785_1 /TAXON_ID=38269 ORGANISM="Gloeochaete wittrockiana, Strain SAG46.84" /NCGR_SAMPLE_ID=MMETSP1089 /ASSEMBLY_ACC=CAM_ASM_000445 /LENGTH=113 /DNA_ID=CAMNT_0026710973 /DNA_START=765 /DNA_END=1103 /DNA_ORIENTATION=+
MAEDGDERPEPLEVEQKMVDFDESLRSSKLEPSVNETLSLSAATQGEDWLGDPLVLVKYFKEQFEKATSAEVKKICAEQLSAAYEKTRMANKTSDRDNAANGKDNAAKEVEHW